MARKARSMVTLTKRQRELFDHLDTYIRRNGYAPTLEEIGREFGLSSLATVHKHLSNLEAKGLIRRKWNHSRALQVVPQRARVSAVQIPLLGNVAAGRPIENIESDDTIAVPEEMVRRENTFVLRVAGDSMVGEGILDGDYIVVESRQAAENGETVVAVLNGEATVKKLYREKGGEVRLQPANPTMEALRVCDGDLQIRGVVVGVIRRY